MSKPSIFTAGAGDLPRPLSGADALRIVDASPDVILVTRADGTIVFVNAQVGAAFGYPPAEVVGQKVELLIPERFRARHVGIRENYAANGERRAIAKSDRFVGRRKDGSEFPLSLGLSPVRDAEGTWVICVVRDLSELKRLEETNAEQSARLEQMARLVELGRGAAAIAHEVRNPLAILQGDLQLLARRCKDTGGGPQESAVIDRMRRNTERIGRIVRALLAHARCGAAEPPRPVTVRALLDEAQELCRPRAKLADIALSFSEEVDPELLLEGHPTLLTLALVNLINNACDAVAPSGERWIRVEARDEGAEVVLRVIDSGPGVPQALRQELMREFVTTKPADAGLGLGLALARTIASEHGGVLSHDEGAPHTQFTIRLPKARPAARIA